MSTTAATTLAYPYELRCRDARLFFATKADRERSAANLAVQGYALFYFDHDNIPGKGE